MTRILKLLNNTLNVQFQKCMHFLIFPGYVYIPSSLSTSVHFKQISEDIHVQNVFLLFSYYHVITFTRASSSCIQCIVDALYMAGIKRIDAVQKEMTSTLSNARDPETMSLAISRVEKMTNVLKSTDEEFRRSIRFKSMVIK